MGPSTWVRGTVLITAWKGLRIRCLCAMFNLQRHTRRSLSGFDERSELAVVRQFRHFARAVS